MTYRYNSRKDKYLFCYCEADRARKMKFVKSVSIDGEIETAFITSERRNSKGLYICKALQFRRTRDGILWIKIKPIRLISDALFNKIIGDERLYPILFPEYRNNIKIKKVSDEAAKIRKKLAESLLEKYLEEET